MADTEYLTVVNWENYQHYKDRNPPWIKLHRDLLRDYKFIQLSDDAKLHLMLIWLLASQMDNKIPADAKFVAKQINVKNALRLKELIDNGFLCDASNMLATCKQLAIVETETETETETDIYAVSFLNFWKEYPRKIDKKKASKSYKTAVKKSDEKTILTAVKKYALECQKDKTEKNYIKHPTSWLNGECWENYNQPTEKLSMADALVGVAEYKHNQLKLNYRRGEHEERFRKATGYGYADIQ